MRSPLANNSETHRTLEEILATCSDVLVFDGEDNTPFGIDSCGPDGDTPLHVMAWQKDVTAMKVLINAGANVNAIGDMSETPLHVAIRMQHLEMVKELLKAGAVIDVVSEFGESPKAMAHKIGGEVAKLF